MIQTLKWNGWSRRKIALVAAVVVLASGADPNAQQQGGYTALQSAAMHDDHEMAKALLEAGADRSIKNDEGLTAEDMAAKAGSVKVVELLRSHQAGAIAG